MQKSRSSSIRKRELRRCAGGGSEAIVEAQAEANSGRDVVVEGVSVRGAMRMHSGLSGGGGCISWNLRERVRGWWRRNSILCRTRGWRRWGGR
nr:hypothetical protein Itr_chr01CG11950 [Ipomoea trifida]